MCAARTDCFCDSPELYGGYARRVDDGPKPCYLPQPEDKMPAGAAGNAPELKMGVMGPWATGRVDWAPLKGMTGTRPVVDRYSLTRYSLGEWRARNAGVFKGTDIALRRADLGDFNMARCIEQTVILSDKNQRANKRRLFQRAFDLRRWGDELETTITEMDEEILLLEGQRQRLKVSLKVMYVPEAIAGECLTMRSTRMEGDLVRDEVEEELIKEVALDYEVRQVMNRLLEQMEEQLVINRTAKLDLEMDWSDKKETLDIELYNASLDNDSTTIHFFPGSTRIPGGQSTPASWEQITSERHEFCMKARSKSCELRHLLESMLNDVARDLRTQADKVEHALAKKVELTDTCRDEMETDLKKCLKRITDTEEQVGYLKDAIRRNDQSLKVAQTRLHTRLQRVRVEFCRDAAQYGLVDEAKCLAESNTALNCQMHEAMTMLGVLYELRVKLEKEVMVKRKSLAVDRDLCQRVRTRFPTTSALIGY